ncbi:MAG: alcohol dehydrogenase catalytic domain-containing protein, partial [Acidimicrobiia bacterium]
MRALVKHPDEIGLRLSEVEMPEPGPDQLLIKVGATGICGTDLHIYQWDTWASENIPAPMTVGHEFAGTIEAVGSGVSGFEIGELVGAEGHVVCN